MPREYRGRDTPGPALSVINTVPVTFVSQFLARVRPSCIQRDRPVTIVGNMFEIQTGYLPNGRTYTKTSPAFVRMINSKNSVRIYVK
jgi:hypothetical protein